MRFVDTLASQFHPDGGIYRGAYFKGTCADYELKVPCEAPVEQHDKEQLLKLSYFFVCLRL